MTRPFRPADRRSIKETAPPEPRETYWIVPAAGQRQGDAIDRLKKWLDLSRWGIRDGGTLRRGDRLAFYVGGTGVVAHGRVAAAPTRRLVPGDLPVGVAANLSLWRVDLDNVRWLKTPCAFTPGLIGELAIMRGRRSPNWGWLVHTKRRIPPEDFHRLISDT